MRVIKCDRCRKVIKDKGPKSDGANGTIFHEKGFLSFDFCNKCAKPLLKNIEKYLKIKSK